MEYLKLFETHQNYEDYVSGGTMVKPNVSLCEQENEVHYNPKLHDYKKDYFTIESLENNNTIYWEATSTAIKKTISASTDNGETWTAFTASYCDDDPMAECLPTEIATLNVGEKTLIKGENSAYATSVAEYNKFSTNGQFEVKGNIMSLISGDSFANADELTATYTFSSLFRECTGLTSAEKIILPATTLASNCYRSMFASCTSLTTAPELPATTLEYRCYESMFRGCTSLTTAPELPAMTLTYRCYTEMFRGCTSLTTAPDLPATALANECYYKMFSFCESLNYIKCLALDDNETNVEDWVRDVASSGTFVKNVDAIWERGWSGIPSGWTEETATA